MQFVFKVKREIDVNLIKSLLSHKYIKRTGTPKHYKYWYKTPDNKFISTNVSPELVKQADERQKELEKIHKKVTVSKQKELKEEQKQGFKDIKQSKFLKEKAKTKNYSNPKGYSLRLNNLTYKDIEKLRKDKIYQNEFIKQNEAFINDTMKWAKKSFVSVLDFADKKQAGMIGMLNAINKVPKKNYKKGSFLQYVRMSVINEINSYINQFTEGSKKGFTEISLDKPIIKEEGEKTNLYDEVARKIDDIHHIVNPQEIVEFKDNIKYIGDQLKKKEKKQTGRKEGKNLYKVWDLLVNGYTQAQIARKLKVSKPLISKMMKKYIVPLVNEHLAKSNNKIWNLFKNHINNMMKEQK